MTKAKREEEIGKEGDRAIKEKRQMKRRRQRKQEKLCDSYSIKLVI